MTVTIHLPIKLRDKRYCDRCLIQEIHSTQVAWSDTPVTWWQGFCKLYERGLNNGVAMPDTDKMPRLEECLKELGEGDSDGE